MGKRILVVEDEPGLRLPEVWGYTAAIPTRTLDVQVAWLRQKLEPSAKTPVYILTVRGFGYKFEG